MRSRPPVEKCAPCRASGGVCDVSVGAAISLECRVSRGRFLSAHDRTPTRCVTAKKPSVTAREGQQERKNLTRPRSRAHDAEVRGAQTNTEQSVHSHLFSRVLVVGRLMQQRIDLDAWVARKGSKSGGEGKANCLMMRCSTRRCKKTTRQRPSQQLRRRRRLSWQRRQQAAESIAGLNLNGLSRDQVVEKLNGIRRLRSCTTRRAAKGVPMMFKEDKEDAGVTSCAFFVDPHEAKHSLEQAKSQHPDMNLVIGVMPLGKAYALCVGWATSAQQRVPFTLRAANPAAKQMRPILKKQLEVQGLPAYWHFPVFLCEELQSDTCLPVFLSKEGLLDVWAGAGKGTEPPTSMTVTDLRIIVSEMQKGFRETGCDWSIVRFLGTEQGWNAIKEGVEQEEGRSKQQQQGSGGSGGSGGGAKGASAAVGGVGKEEQHAGPADPEHEPPELV